MAKFSLSFVFLVLMVVLALAMPEERYTSKYDNVDVDEILSNPRLRKQYENCLMSKAACITPDARFLKDKFPEALVTKCRKCTEKQKEFFEKITIWYSEHDPDTWSEIVAKTISNIKNGQH